jgi:hypothetical protein
MSSALEVVVCNLALGHIAQSGLITSIDPPDASLNAEQCAMFFPTARDTLLEMHAWRFATTRKALTQITNTSAGWAFAYQFPTDVIRPLALLAPGSTDDTKTYPYTVEADYDTGSSVLYTNVEDATLKFIRRVTDSSKWTPLFLVTLSWLLAHYIAGPITKKPTVVKAALDMFIAQFKLASGSDASGQNVDVWGFTPSHLQARGVTTVPDARILR